MTSKKKQKSLLSAPFYLVILTSGKDLLLACAAASAERGKKQVLRFAQDDSF